MNKKRLFSFLLATCILSGISVAFAAEAGSAQDPLVSKSYVDGAYSEQIMSEPVKNLKDSVKVLEYKLAQVASAKAADIKVLTVSPGGSITVSTGGSFTLLSGSAGISRLSGALIDVTDGTVLSGGRQLDAGHRYVAGENTSVILTVSSAAKLSALGNVSVSSGSGISFTDVKANAWFYDYVLYTVEKGLINGKSNTSFVPDDYLRINEAIKLAACMHQLYSTGEVTLKNGEPYWYSSYVNYAVNNGIISTTYPDYDAFITRDEFVNIFYSALPSSEYAAKNNVTDGAIPDVKMTDEYASRIYIFYRAGILNGKEADGSFWPDRNILRSEVTAIIARMFEKDQRVSVTLR